MAQTGSPSSDDRVILEKPPVRALRDRIAAAVRVTGSGIVFTWDPNWDAADHPGETRQRLLTLNDATINFPSFGIEGLIVPHEGKPGLIVYTVFLVLEIKRYAGAEWAALHAYYG